LTDSPHNGGFCLFRQHGENPFHENCQKVTPMKSDAIGRTRSIRAVIRSEERRLRALHPWLNRQDLLGMGCFLGSLATMAGIATLYLQGMLAWWLTIPLMALPLSILHEIEHDLIHDLYFKSRAGVQSLMFFVIWFGKLGLNPWYRREIHLKHHRESGQVSDIEERLIGLGLPFGLLRLFVAIHPFGGLLLFRRIKREVPDFQPLRLYLLSVPTYTLLFVIWESFCGYARVQSGWTFAMDPGHLLPAWGWPWARDLTLLLVLPNMLRQSCLVFISSYSHYYEDIPEHDVFYQTQILSNWLLAPFQLFCFNFGATHIIHHYVINQPFYLRQMVARAAHAEMSRHGTRVNDLGALVRANRWNDGSNDQLQTPAQAIIQAPVQDLAEDLVRDSTHEKRQLGAA
jgi:fatty acid desaturase